MSHDFGTDLSTAEFKATVGLADRLRSRGVVRPRTVFPRGSAKGSEITDAFGDGGTRLGLVLFYREQIVALLVSDVPAGLALTIDGIARDDGAFEWQIAQKCWCRSDFILLGRHDVIAHDAREFRRECRDDVQRRCIVAARTT